LKYDGPQAKFFYIWIALCRALLHRLIFHENVVGFGKEELCALLGDLYLVVRVELFVDEFGWPVTRARQICWMLLKLWVNPVLLNSGLSETDVVDDSIVEQFLNLKASFTFLFHRRYSYNLVGFGCASQAQIDKDLHAKQSRPSVLLRAASIDQYGDRDRRRNSFRFSIYHCIG
jgi:hypothetical protein